MEERGTALIVCVVDASAVGPLIIVDERESLLPGLVSVLDGGRTLVPSHWHVEVANAMRSAVRRGRLTDAALDQGLDLLRQYRIEEDDMTGSRAWAETLRLARRHALTVYDAAYLELALRRRAGLASLDGALVRAARAEGVELLTA